jgi:hypothetical protein
MKLIRNFILGAMVAFSSIAMMACDDDDSPTGTNDPGKSMVMAIHTSPNAPAVDILVDNAIAETGLGFTENTGYLEVTAGSRNLKVNVSGADPVVTVIDLDVPLTANVNYSVFAIDSVESLSALATVDDLTSPAAGKAHVRFIHLSPNAPAVDITDTNGNIVFGDYEFAEFSDFTPLDAATYDLQVRLQGTTTVVLELPGIALSDGNIYTVYAKGFVGGDGNQALGAEIIVNK